MAVMAAVDGGGGDGDDGGDRCRQQRWAVAVSAAADVGGGDVGGAGRRRARAAIAAKGWRGQKGWRWRLGGCGGGDGGYMVMTAVGTADDGGGGGGRVGRLAHRWDGPDRRGGGRHPGPVKIIIDSVQHWHESSAQRGCREV